MKNKFFYFVLTCFFAVSMATVNASSGTKALKEKVALMTEAQKEERITQIQQRAEEIKAMDKSQLTRIERKDLRKELKNMNKEAKEIGHGGIYISLAGLIIIILLLILIL